MFQSSNESASIASNLEQGRDDLGAVQSVTDLTIENRHLDDMLSEVLERIQIALECSTATVLLVTDDRGHLVERASVGTEDLPRHEEPIPFGEGVVGEIATTLQSRSIRDLDTEITPGSTLVGRGIRSALGTPLAVGDELVGVLHVGQREEREFTEDDIRHLELIAQRLAVAVVRTLAFESERQSLRFLSAASARLQESLDYDATLEEVARLAVPDMADWCVVDALNDDQIEMVAVAHRDPEKVALVRELRQRYPVDTSRPYGLAAVLRTGQPEIYPQIDPHWRQSAARDAAHLHLMETLDARSSLCVPLRARGRTLGAMTFVRSDPHQPYGGPEMSLAMSLARRCALALDNARLYREAQEAIALRDGVLATVSHDLKNPLTSLIGTSQILRMQTVRTGQASADEVVRRTQEIERHAARMSAMIGEIVDAARLHAGASLDLQPRRTNLLTMVREVVKRHEAMQDDYRVTLATNSDEVVGLWDVPRLERVLENLLDNAIKYSPAGGTISVHVTLGHVDAQQWVTIEVRDQGIGIPSADIPRIFDRFRRGSNVVGRIAGTGLGLHGAREIVRLHGGTVEIDSRERRGTTISVRLPLKPKASAE